MSAIADNTVIAWRGEAARYSEQAPFSPSHSYSEYALGETAADRNPAYEAVRGCFQTAALDASRFGSPDWNPLCELIHPGETVLLKPNMVHQRHPRDPEGWRYMITHGSIIRAVADYVWKAVGPTGKIIVADAPQTDASFAEMSRLLGLNAIREFYKSRGLTFDIIDLRQEEWTTRGDVVVERRKLPPNPYGAVAFDLGQASEFVDHRGSGHYYGADYDAGVVNRHHSRGKHEYLIAGCAIKCDVVFSLPKWKTHKKAGITASLKIWWESMRTRIGSLITRKARRCAAETSIPTLISSTAPSARLPQPFAASPFACQSWDRGCIAWRAAPASRFSAIPKARYGAATGLATTRSGACASTSTKSCSMAIPMVRCAHHSHRIASATMCSLTESSQGREEGR